MEEYMEEYKENGTILDWLIDPQTKRVAVYRQGQPVEILFSSQILSGKMYCQDLYLTQPASGIEYLW